MERRLTTIIAADIAGFSRLVGADEEGTLAAQRAHRTELVDPLIAEHGGRIANTAGDSLLVEFPSAVEAVRCAVEAQAGMSQRNADMTEDRRILYRIGINTGDVVAEGDDLLGDGVNIAARLEALAPPGGIIISRPVRDYIADRLDLVLADLGEVEVKNIARPVRAFQVLRDGEEAIRPTAKGRRRRLPVIAAAAAGFAAIAALGAWSVGPTDFWSAGSEKMQIASDSRPSLAVLAFDNLTGDPEQEHISDGFSEDIITALARVPGLVVMARNSSFVYKGKPVDVEQVGRELGVRHVLEGSVQQSGDTIRITAQLIDASNGHHVWSKNYDRPASDVFAVRDEIIREIIAELNIQLVDGEAYWARGETIKSLEAWQIAHKAHEFYERANGPDNQIALKMMERVLELEPESPQAHAWLSWRHAMNARMSWTDDPKASLAEAVRLAEAAIAIDPESPGGNGALAFTRLVDGRVKDAVALGEKVVDLVPGDAGALFLLAFYYQKDMQAERSIKMYREAIRRNPKANMFVYENFGEALVIAGRYEEAISMYKTAFDHGAAGAIAAECRIGLAISYNALGERENATEQIALLIEHHPKFTLTFLRGFALYSDPDYTARWLATLEQLGLPEG